MHPVLGRSFNGAVAPPDAKCVIGPQTALHAPVMQSAQDWATKNVPDAIDSARDRRIFLQG
jgi:hypothetical protein